jgi:hypothetical protein
MNNPLISLSETSIKNNYENDYTNDFTFNNLKKT